MNITYCQWFTDNEKQLSTLLPKLSDFNDNDNDINKSYKNVLTDFKLTNFKDNIIKIEEPGICESLLKSHKYMITFNQQQHQKLQLYFKECEFIYNLCVDIWKNFKFVTTTWQILKDVIYKHVYRVPCRNNYQLLIDKIIKDLVKLQEQFNLDTEKNKEVIQKLKAERDAKFKIIKDEYDKQVELNKNAVIKKELIKPKKPKLNLDFLKKPRKDNSDRIEKPAPDEMLKAEIKTFCVNLKNAKNQALENKKNIIYGFDIKYKNTKLEQTVSIDERGLSVNGIYPAKLGKLKCEKYEKITQKYKLNKGCKLTFDKTIKKYYLHVVEEDKIINIDNRYEVCAVDEGEKIFACFYSPECKGKLGDNMREKILKIQEEIKNLKSNLDKKINKNGKKLKNRKKVLIKIRKLYRKIKGYVNEIQKKSALFLCRNFKNILLPTFSTKDMVKNGKKKELQDNIKFVLNMQSHYKFKMYLTNLSKRYKTKIIEVDESYTSQCCSKCGVLSNNYNYRLKKCINCNYEIDRDENGSTNIFIKSICELKK